ncbi:MAG: hypothetical protein EBR02_03560 [Alphaproteobacteria bacterium]|nr:hypothetical protein [Alphaproteobacteria bacterium]
MSQIPLSLHLPPVFSLDNFYVAACNEEAYRFILSWPNWPTHALLIYGEKGAGKTHLGHVWAEKSGAATFHASEITEFFPPRSAVLIEDIEEIPSEDVLFHLFNSSKEDGLSLLLTSNLASGQFPFSLPDLTSRLLSIPAVKISAPDDNMVAAALRKQFSDRQLKVDDDIIAYILPRIERSLSAVHALVATLDRETLAEGRRLTIPFVKRFL